MSITFSCACGKKYVVSRDLAGKQGKCRGCGRALTIPLWEPDKDCVVPETAINVDASVAPILKPLFVNEVLRVKFVGREKWQFSFFADHVKLQSPTQDREIRFPDPSKNHTFRFGNTFFGSGWNFEITVQGQKLKFRVPSQGLKALKKQVNELQRAAIEAQRKKNRELSLPGILLSLGTSACIFLYVIKQAMPQTIHNFLSLLEVIAGLTGVIGGTLSVTRAIMRGLKKHKEKEHKGVGS